MNSEIGNIVSKEMKKNLNSVYTERENFKGYYEEGIELIKIRDTVLLNKDYKDRDKLNEMIDYYLDNLYKNKLLVPKKINFKIFNNELVYHVEEERLENKSSNYIEVSKNGVYSESDVYSSRIDFFEKKTFSYQLNQKLVADYRREARELNGKILSTDIVFTEDSEVIKLLEEDNFIKDSEGIYGEDIAYYKDYEKEISGEIKNVISDDFRSSKTYDYLSKTYDKNTYLDSIRKLDEFQNEKLLLCIIYKKMNKKFLKRSKIKGLNRRNK